MIKETITYEDFNGEEWTEDFYFHLSKNELSKWELSKEGGLDKFLEKIVQTHNVKELYQMINDLILMSYGEKSPDGKRFVKSEELSKAFSESPAFDELIMEFMTDEGSKLADFVNGLLPKDLAKQVEAEVKKQREEAENSKKDA